MSNDLLEWNLTQTHILTGGGKLDRFSVPNEHFLPKDLPHFHLTHKTTRRQFKQWKAHGKTSDKITGAWSRPLFTGGWTESTGNDTSAFNLQTPSIFIDMRFPTERPDAFLKLHSTLNSCSDFELRVLARQHCFGGYSLPESSSEESRVVFTRHHIIDWNYHPHFPRSRPNRWFIELQMPSKDSFKEHSTVLDENKIPVYFERWQRRLPLAHQTTKYLAMRRKTECPLLKQARLDSLAGSIGGKSEPDRDAILVVVGNHFSLTVDRNYENVLQHMQQCLMNKTHACKGSGAAFVDYLLSESGRHSSDSETDKNRRLAMEYLELEGSYGLVYEHLPDSGATTTAGVSISAARPTWRIQKSTLPWKENRSILSPGEVQFQFNSSGSQYIGKYTVSEESNSSGPVVDTVDIVSSVRWSVDSSSNSTVAAGSYDTLGNNNYCGGDWEVIECSFTRQELTAMFHRDAQPQGIRSRL